MRMCICPVCNYRVYMPRSSNRCVAERKAWIFHNIGGRHAAHVIVCLSVKYDMQMTDAFAHLGLSLIHI